MNKVLFDTDVLLDALDPSRPESDDVCAAFECCSGINELTAFGMVCALSLKDVYRVFAASHGEDLAREAVWHLTGILAIVPISAEECLTALESNEPDFEDGIIRACAELNGCDFIVTRRKQSFAKSKVRSVTASEFMAIIG